MEVLLTLVGTFGFLVFLLDWLWKPKLNLPSPQRRPVIGHVLAFAKAPIMTLSSWAESCGGIYCIQLLNKCVVIVTDYDTANEMLVTRGRDFAGKGRKFRNDMLFKNGQGFAYQRLNPSWERLQIVTCPCVKQFAEGLGHIEDMVHKTAEELIHGIVKDSQNYKIDPYDHMYVAVVKNMTSLVLGTHLLSDDPLFRKITEGEALVLKCISLSKGSELDIMPWLRYFGNETFNNITRFNYITSNIYHEIKEMYHKNLLPKDCVAYALLSETDSNASEGTVKISEENAEVALTELFMAGVRSSTTALYVLLLIMATHPTIQKTIHDEIVACLDQKRKKNQEEDKISLSDQPNMPYTRACLLELLRYVTPAPVSLEHVTMCDTELSGQKLPKGTSVLVNLFGLHHSEKYWDQPWDFNPSRFLDADKNLVARDHVNRKRLMVFGAGTRECVGQSLALARIFILATSLIRAFEVSPADGEEIVHDPRKYRLEGLFSAPHAKICLKKRQLI